MPYPPSHSRSRALAALVALLGGLILAPGVVAEAPPEVKRGQEAEKRGAWLEACRCYDEALRKDRTDVDARAGYQRCLRRFYLVSRHGDKAYRAALAKLTPTQALDLYEQVLHVVSARYVDRGRASFGALFQQGVDELRLALEEDLFLRQYLPGARPEALKAFKAKLATWPASKFATRTEAREHVLVVVRAAQREGLTLRPGAVAAVGLEFAAGACNGLDEHSSLLLPGTFGTAHAAAARSKVVGVGMELVVAGGKLQVARVYPKGPAQEAGLLPGDRVLRIGAAKMDRLKAERKAERAAGLLRGEPGTAVTVEVRRGTDEEGVTRVVELVRRAVVVPSVEHEMVELADGTPAGYLRINYFDETTVQEVKDALASLQTSSGDGLKGLILDLRGNPGGIFKSAVGVADLFLSEGVIVVAQSPSYKEYNRTYKAEGVNPLLVPLVVLVDGETASAAEVLAGALKERAGGHAVKVIGRTTYGKGSIQGTFVLTPGPLEKSSGGVYLTVAKLFTPSGQPYSDGGLSPDVVEADVDGAAGLEKAKEHLAKLLKPMSMSMTMAMR